MDGVFVGRSTSVFRWLSKSKPKKKKRPAPSWERIGESGQTRRAPRWVRDSMSRWESSDNGGLSTALTMKGRRYEYKVFYTARQSVQGGGTYDYSMSHVSPPPTSQPMLPPESIGARIINGLRFRPFWEADDTVCGCRPNSLTRLAEVLECLESH